MLSTLLNIGYLLQIPVNAFFKQPRTDMDEHHDDEEHGSSGEAYNLASSNSMTSAGWQEAPAPSLWAIVMTSSIVILLFFYPAPLLDLLALIQWR